MEVEWNADTTRALATLMEANPILWDKTHEGFKNNVAKFDAYKRIGVELNIANYIEIQNKITKIKGQFFREKKKEEKTTTGQAAGARYVSKWFLMNHLRFLTNSRNVRTTISSTVGNHRVGAIPQSGPINEPDDELDVEEHDDHEDDEALADETQEAEIDRMITAGPSTNQSRVRLTKSFHKRKNEDANLSLAITSLAKSLSVPDTPSSTTQQKRDEFDLIGETVAAKLRKLNSLAIRMNAEHEINNILYQSALQDAGLIIANVSGNDKNDQTDTEGSNYYVINT